MAFLCSHHPLGPELGGLGLAFLSPIVQLFFLPKVKVWVLDILNFVSSDKAL